MDQAPTVNQMRTVEDLLREHTATIEVFARHQVELCCGGKHTIEQVAAKYRIPLETLLAELENAIERACRT